MHKIKKELNKHQFSNYQKHVEQIEIGDNDLCKMSKRILKQHEIIHDIQHNSITYVRYR